MCYGILSLYKKNQKTIQWFKRYSSKAILGLFCPIWAKKEFLQKKYDCIILNVFRIPSLYKNYKKRSNGSKDIAIPRMEQSDWSRALETISREPDFSQNNREP